MNPPPNAHQRSPEIDLLRTVAILMMVFFHLLFDLSYFYGWNIAIRGPFWSSFAHATASLFLFLVGVSFWLRHGRTMNRRSTLQRTLRRGMIILTAALIVSIATFVADPGTFIRFGILHCIGIGILLLPLFAPLREGMMLAGFGVILLRTVFPPMLLGSSEFLLPFGIVPLGFVSLDYYPLIPWFGVMLIGSGIGHLLYRRWTRWRPTQLDRIPCVLTWPGRHALLIYLMHQPLLLAFLWLVVR